MQVAHRRISTQPVLTFPGTRRNFAGRMHVVSSDDESGSGSGSVIVGGCGNGPRIREWVLYTEREAKLGKHVRILGWLHIVLGVIDLLIGMMGFGVLTGIGAVSGDPAAFGIMSGIGGFVGALMLIMALPNLIVGLGLLRNWGGWVIVVAVVLGVINLMNFPIGTAIALYTFWIAWRLYDTPTVV